jgi:hypothetical protein
MEPIVTAESVRPRRKSAFRETGLFDDECEPSSPTNIQMRPALKVRFRSKNEVFEHTLNDGQGEEAVESDAESEPQRVSAIPVVTQAGSSSMSSLINRLSLVALVLAIVIPIAQLTPLGGNNHPILGATGVPIAEQPEPIFDEVLSKRADATDYCKRWSQQSRCLILRIRI